jgi:hypothetical protein
MVHFPHVIRGKYGVEDAEHSQVMRRQKIDHSTVLYLYYNRFPGRWNVLKGVDFIHQGTKSLHFARKMSKLA